MKSFILVLFLWGITLTAQGAGLVQEGYLVFDKDKIFLPLFESNPELTLDHIQKQGYELYGPYGLGEWLERLGVEVISLDQKWELTSGYPTPEQINQQIWQLHSQCKGVSHVFSLGKSIQGRDILGIKISDNPTVDEVEPEFKYISSMHGNEITGRELMVRLMEDLCQGYGQDSRITQLIQNTEIFIIPSMNPDGSAAQGRGNAEGYDLNRDFPDFSTSDNQNRWDGRQRETQLVMQFQHERNFALSANFHGGASVVNYPWDTIPEDHPFLSLVKDISLKYASSVPYMRDSTEFPSGITNGYAWYEVDGGMQDWSYHWYGDLQLTIELSDAKWPSYGQIDTFYKQNRSALIGFIQEVHQGAGFTFAASKARAQEIKGVVRLFQLEGRGQLDLGTYGFHRSEFFKVLPPGKYIFKVTTESGKKYEFSQKVEEETVYPNGNYHQL